MTDFLHFLLAHHLDRSIHEVADDRLHVAADIAHLGELGGFDLDKGGVGQLGQSPGDFGLAHARWPNHQNILWRDFVAQLRLHSHPPPAVAQRDGNGTLGGILADDVFVQFLGDLSGGHLRHGEATVSAKGENGTTAASVVKIELRARQFFKS